DVFIWALCRNADDGFDGRIPRHYFEPRYLARLLDMSEREVEEGIASCEATDLLRVTERDVEIVGWDAEEWGAGGAPLSGAERTRRWRERRRKPSEHREPVTPASPRDAAVTCDDRGEEKRREESRDPLCSPPGGDPPGHAPFAEGTSPGARPDLARSE